MAEKKQILILGGGYAGVAAGKKLHKIFKNDDSVEITLIDKKPYHTLMTELHEVAGHRTEPDAIQIDLRTIFAGRKVKVVTDSITNVDLEGKKLVSDKKTYKFDYLVLACGSDSNSFGIEGVDEHAFTLWSYEDAVKLRAHVEKMFQLAAIEEDEAVRKQLLTFAVVGGGFTGVEMVGELGEAKDHLAVKYGVDKKEVTIYNIEATPRILNTLKDEKQIAKVENRYKKLGIELLKNAALVKATEDGFELKDGRFIKTKTLVWGAGIKVSNFIGKLGLEAGRGGRVLVNKYMQTLKYENVFMAGDNTHYEDKDGFLPQIVEAAEQSGHTAAVNIGALINKTEMHEHKQNYHGFMVSIGSKYAVSDNNGLKFNGFFAVMVKHMVNFYYLFLVSGLAQLSEYVMNEFFRIKNRRSVFGGHFAKASPNFWMLPLRMFLGVMWLIEGINKIDEGWLVEAKMYASDAVTQASEWVEEGTTAVKPLIETVPGVVQWGIDNIIAPHAVLFQTGMVFMEIIFGLMLIGGLFTFIAGIMTTIMTVGITLTGMSDASILWFFFAGIAVIGGSGSAFGMDYYVLPWLKKWWKKTPLARKSYLYFH
ncbi:FAD-dependent oxidoreductase [Fusibacter bizertensis]|uniref:NADH:ubiquinone reductase (non-electrogenic) n=1 Tax=Fusibacter bizertensis TaxID=1488331 RepID=A0ABT6NFD5_9FIRM|nr:FAD-dependent oxidoreductase [Fusibacter bizertensis]MDH8679145.1 FAD-dependent oxidoreductase [Fusibacter bizertensis]